MAELNGKYVNEDKHQKVKSKLKKIGYILLGVGAVLAIIGLIMLISGFRSPRITVFVGGGILLVIGSGMFTYGIYATFFAHIRDITSYGASSVAPVISDTTNYVADETSPSVEKVSSSISKGMQGNQTNGKTQSQNTNIKYCSKCGAKNTADSKFCTRCGNKFSEN